MKGGVSPLLLVFFLYVAAGVAGASTSSNSITTSVSVTRPVANILLSGFTASPSSTTVGSIRPVANVSTPNITIAPRSGVIQPRSNLFFNVTVVIPANAVPGTSWSAGVAVVENSAVNVTSGAKLQGGVSKIVSITALPPKFNPLAYAVVAAFVAVGAGTGFYLYFKDNPPKAPPAKRSARKAPGGRRAKGSRKGRGRKRARARG